VSARVVSLAVPLAGLLFAAPALAQEPPPPIHVPAGPCTVVVVVPDGGCAPTVVQIQPQGPAPAPYQAPYPPGPYYAPMPPPAYYGPPQAYYPVPEPLVPRRSASVFSAKVWAGPSYERLYDLSLYGADFGVALGAQRGISGWYAEIEGNIGRTDHGLGTYQYWVGGSWEGKIDRVHLGLGVHLGFLGINRATTGDMMTGFGFGAFGFASVDLYQSEGGHALYLGAKITGNVMQDGAGGAPALWGPSAMLGWRY
jgi:hypothetical protein